jgi:predicted naringenin-chalcone synthase
MRISTAERMAIFEREAPPLAERAALAALRAAKTNASAITDLVIVTCTGFSAPGVGHALVERLGLSDRVRHAQLGFMGCFGGVVGLRTACGLASADRAAVVLVVCVELCSLHLRDDTDPQQLVASALFADGAAAAVVRSAGGGLGAISPGRTRLLAHASEAMTWRILDDGFAMTLTRDVPRELEESIAEFVREGAARGLAIHPGGAGIIDAIERGLRGIELDPHTFPATRAVLRDYGNMSSGSVLFVLDEYLRRGGALPVDVIAFGPGLTVDCVQLTAP